ncbi:unnamed protein product, partial [Lymnaea stagnalis]
DTTSAISIVKLPSTYPHISEPSTERRRRWTKRLKRKSHSSFKMAAAFVGKWKLGKVEGAEEYLAAVGGADTINDIINIKEVNISVDGNNFTSVVNIEGKEPRKDTSVLGETVETDAPGGIKLKIKTYVEGEQLIQAGNAGGVEWKV